VAAPDGQKRLLQHILRRIAVADDAQGQAKKLRRGALVQLFQRGVVLRGDAV